MEQLQRIEQQLSQQQLQNLELLQMSELDVREEIRRIAMENPVIDEVLPEDDYSDTRLIRESEKILAKWKWLENGDVQNRSYHPEWEAEISPLELAGNAGGLEETLSAFLKSQIDQLKPDADRRAVLDYLIDSLEGDGYLRTGAEDLAEETELPVELIREGLRTLQSLEPAGVGAGSLSECLCLQLQRKGASPLTQQIARDYLEELGKYHDNAIAAALSVGRDQVEAARREIQQLDPRPGSHFYSDEPTVYVRPDVYVTEQDGVLHLKMAREEQAWFGVNEYYKQLFMETDDEEVKRYLAEKLKQAAALRFGLRQRESTVKRCAEAILLHQSDYFRQGSAALKPLSMSELADELRLHVSTISRAVRNKYLESVQGIVPLSYFFSRRASQNTESAMGQKAAMALLQDMIDREDKLHPLSDQKLCERMAEKGCEISRRTVAKYRDLMGIPGTVGRRQNAPEKPLETERAGRRHPLMESER